MTTTLRSMTIAALSATGGSGAATKSAVSTYKIRGTIRSVQLTYHDSPPGTTDVLVKTTTDSATVLSISNAATDGVWNVVAQAHHTDGTTFTGVGAPLIVDDTITVTISQANNGDGVTAKIIYEVSEQ